MFVYAQTRIVPAVYDRYNMNILGVGSGKSTLYIIPT